jgi:drug/metabolite transporter (DMT)-like permease
LAIIGVLNNLSPVCCVVLAYFMLGEKLKVSEMIVMALIVGCIFDIVIGAKPSTTG